MLRLTLLVSLAVLLGVAQSADNGPPADKREEVDVSGSSNNPVYSSAPSYDSPSYDDPPPRYKSSPSSPGNLYYYYYPLHDKHEGDNGYSASSNQGYSSNGPSGGFQGNSDSSYEPQESSYGGGGYPPSYGGPSYAPPPSYSSPGPSYPSYPGPPPPQGPSGYMPGPGYSPYVSGSAPMANYGPPMGPSPYGNHFNVPYQPVAQGSSQSPRRYGLGSLIMPMLALAGLGLLIPSVTNVKGRKKREVDAEGRSAVIGEYRDKLERYYSVYKKAVQSDQCMGKIICELGTSIGQVQGKTAIFSILEKVVPDWMKVKVGVMKSAVADSETGKCSKYKC